MGKNYDPDVRCLECLGEGETQCECCGNDTECLTCKGEGLDPSKIDIVRFRAAEKVAFANAPAHEGSWELIEDNVWVGRQNNSAKVYYRDFMITPPEPEPK